MNAPLFNVSRCNLVRKPACKSKKATDSRDLILKLLLPPPVFQPCCIPGPESNGCSKRVVGLIYNERLCLRRSHLLPSEITFRNGIVPAYGITEQQALWYHNCPSSGIIHSFSQFFTRFCLSDIQNPDIL